MKRSEAIERARVHNFGLVKGTSISGSVTVLISFFYTLGENNYILKAPRTK